jgi:predicted Zn-dependent protease
MLKGSTFLLTLVLASSLSLRAQSNGDFSATNMERPLQRSSSLIVSHTQSITGAVSSFSGQPVKGARVEIRNLATGEVVASAYTADNGAFAIDNVPTGTYDVVAQQGLSEARERITFQGGDVSLNLRMPQEEASDVGGRNSVSVAQMKVPEKARKQLKKAREAVQKQNVEEAQKYLTQALEAYPNYAEALTLRGILKLDGKQYDAAAQDLEAAIRADPNYPLAYFALGASYNLLSRWDDATRALQHGLGLEPNSWQGHFELSKTLIAQKQYEAALGQLSKAEGENAKYALIHLLKAHALLGLKNYPDAMTELETYLQREPNGTASAQAKQTLDKVRAFVATK